MPQRQHTNVRAPCARDAGRCRRLGYGDGKRVGRFTGLADPHWWGASGPSHRNDLLRRHGRLHLGRLLRPPRAAGHLRLRLPAGVVQKEDRGVSPSGSAGREGPRLGLGSGGILGRDKHGRGSDAGGSKGLGFCRNKEWLKGRAKSTDKVAKTKDDHILRFDYKQPVRHQSPTGQLRRRGERLGLVLVAWWVLRD